MLLIIGIILIVLWGAGLIVHVAGGLIHLLLLVAIVMIVLHVLRGPRGV